MTEENPTTSSDAVEWTPGKSVVLFMNIAGIALMALGLVLYFLAWAGEDGSTSFVFSGLAMIVGLVVTLALTFILMVIHEAIHGVVVAAFGARPKFGVTMIGKAIPAFYCTAPGKRFTKTQFLIVALAPLVILGGLLFPVVAFVPLGGWLVLPAAIHLGGCVGDMALAWVAARQPRGTLIEDMKSGMRFYR